MGRMVKSTFYGDIMEKVFRSKRSIDAEVKSEEIKYWGERLDFWMNERDLGNMTHGEAVEAIRAEKLASNVLDKVMDNAHNG